MSLDTVSVLKDEKNPGDGLHNSVNVFNAIGLST